jgi:hypothetical protein
MQDLVPESKSSRRLPLYVGAYDDATVEKVDGSMEVLELIQNPLPATVMHATPLGRYLLVTEEMRTLECSNIPSSWPLTLSAMV